MLRWRVEEDSASLSTQTVAVGKESVRSEHMTSWRGVGGEREPFF